LATTLRRIPGTPEPKRASVQSGTDKSNGHPGPDLCSTGIPGLDAVLCGGLPRNRVYLVEGSPGAGKTTLALQFLLEGVRQKESVLYITLSETKEELVAVARSHGWSLEGVSLFELSGIEQMLKAETENTFFHPSEVELNKTTKILMGELERVKPTRVVFDSLSEMRLMAETPLRFRRQMLNFKQFFAGRNCTVLLLDDLSAGNDQQIESIAHGVVALDGRAPDYSVSRRTVNVRKIRGVKFHEGFHDFVIEKGGLLIFPRLVAAEHHQQFKTESFHTGIKSLDALLGGGLERGTSTMFLGPPGSGKSTLTIKYASTAAGRGEKTRVYIFDETVRTLVARAKALGMDVQPHLKSGMMRIQKISPAEISPGQFAHEIRRAVEEENTRMVIIDSINGYLNAMSEDRHLNLQLHEMLAYLNQQGVLTIMVLAQQGLVGQMYSSVDLTYLADSVVLFRYFEAAGEVKQAISVIKKRSGNHERTIREFKVDTNGVRVGAPLAAFHGVLTGVPTFSGDTKDILKAK